MNYFQKKATSFSISKYQDIETGRLGWVDYARGLAILLVVYRHTMVGLIRSGLNVPYQLFSIQEFLLNVRMPVFFVLSGVFLARAYEKRPVLKVFKKKVNTLLYPYLLWSVILISIQILLNKYTNSNRTAHDYLYIITQPRELDHMWYLLALFNTTMLMLLLFRFALKYPLFHFTIALTIHFFYFYFIDYSLFSDLMYNYIFLVSGVQAYKYIQNLEKISLARLILIFLMVLPFFIAGQLYWLNNIDDNYRPLKEWYLFPFLLIILVACIIYYLASRILFKSGRAKWLGWIGRYSLYIYILHILVISSERILFSHFLGVTNVYFLITLSLASGILVPIFVYRSSEKLGGRYLFSLEKQTKTKSI